MCSSSVDPSSLSSWTWFLSTPLCPQPISFSGQHQVCLLLFPAVGGGRGCLGLDPKLLYPESILLWGPGSVWDWPLCISSLQRLTLGWLWEGQIYTLQYVHQSAPKVGTAWYWWDPNRGREENGYGNVRNCPRFVSQLMSSHFTQPSYIICGLLSPGPHPLSRMEISLLFLRQIIVPKLVTSSDLEAYDKVVSGTR